MVLSEDYSPYTFEMVSQIPHLAGIFELADERRNIIFIGKAVDLKNELLQIFDTYNPCLDAARFYRIEINPEVDSAYRKLMLEYKEEFHGKLPKCNKHDPTLMEGFRLTGY